jgi:hypothetical protein
MTSAPGQYERQICCSCGGSGTPHRGEVQYCMGCGGQGGVMVAQPATECPHCGGTGSPAPTQRAGKVCRYCGGCGWSLRYIPLPLARNSRQRAILFFGGIEMAVAYEVLVKTGRSTPQEFMIIADSVSEAEDKLNKYRANWRQTYNLDEIASIKVHVEAVVLT